MQSPRLSWIPNLIWGDMFTLYRVALVQASKPYRIGQALCSHVQTISQVERHISDGSVKFDPGKLDGSPFSPNQHFIAFCLFLFLFYFSHVSGSPRLV